MVFRWQDSILPYFGAFSKISVVNSQRRYNPLAFLMRCGFFNGLYASISITFPSSIFPNCSCLSSKKKDWQPSD
jgi:hypothetical protein